MNLETFDQKQNYYTKDYKFIKDIPMVKMKTNKKTLLASKKEKMHKIKNKTSRRDTKRVKSRGGRSLKSIKTKRLELKSKKVKKIIKPIRRKRVEEDAPIENFGNEEFVNFTNQVEISKEDEKILEQFQINFSAFEENKDDLADKIQDIVDENVETKKQADIKENVLNDPNVKLVYQDIAKIMKEYTSGKIAKPFKAIPMLDQWEKVLEMTKPTEWSPHAMFAATRMFASSLDQYRAKTFYEKYLLPAVREDIKKNKKLNYHYYQALIKAFYKPAAWFKGILFPLCKSNNCSIKEAQIFSSVLSKLSIPVMHSSVAIVKIAEMGFTGATAIFIKTLLEKKYALPTRVLNVLVSFFVKYEDSEVVLPVIFFQLILRVCELYSTCMDEMQKSAIKSLVKKRKHEILSPLIITAIDNISKKEIAEKNLEKSLGNVNKMILE